MTKTFSKNQLIRLARAVTDGEKIEVGNVEPFLEHSFEESSLLSRFMIRLAAWISLFFASVLVIFPEVGEWLIGVLPDFFLLSDRLATALDYVWGLVGQKVKEQHLMYHLPNIIIYAFGAAGVRQLWRRLHKDNWKDRVQASQQKLANMISEGTTRISFAPGFSMLMVGKGDHVAKSLVLDNVEIGPTIGSSKPTYTDLWAGFYTAEGDRELKRVFEQFNTEEAGEYILFPVVDENLFLPGPDEYDTPPHRMEVAVQLIREHEEALGWSRKRIIIVGDREQQSRFVTTSQSGVMAAAHDDVSLGAIENKHKDVIVVDPTEVTLRKILEVADGREILFRASDDGVERYAAPFYERLSLLGYNPTEEGTLTIGYDMSDLETEHQVMARNHDEYMPVILSRDIFDLIENCPVRGRSFIFVPRLVMHYLKELSLEERRDG